MFLPVMDFLHPFYYLNLQWVCMHEQSQYKRYRFTYFVLIVNLVIIEKDTLFDLVVLGRETERKEKVAVEKQVCRYKL